jgi:hypothetical protein
MSAACSSNPSTATTTSTSAHPTSTSGSVTTTSASASTTTSAGTQRCEVAGLQGSAGGSSGAAGTIETTFVLKNTGSTACILGGYPGLQLLGSSGASLPTKVVRGGSYSFTSMSPTTVTLAPGEAVAFNVGYSDVPVDNETSCPTSSSLEITPPNAYDHLVVPASLAPCGGGTLVVSPVFSTTGSGSQTTAPAGG